MTSGPIFCSHNFSQNTRTNKVGGIFFLKKRLPTSRARQSLATWFNSHAKAFHISDMGKAMLPVLKPEVSRGDESHIT
jgi:hypothetical protein